MTTNTMKRLAVCASCALLLAATSGCGSKTEDTDANITTGNTAMGTAANASGSVANSAGGTGLPAGVPPDAAPRR